jgi:apolipoprotein N-acyltransferase
MQAGGRWHEAYPLQLLIAAVFGAVMTLSFAPSYAWWLTPFCLAGLFLMLPGKSVPRAASLGFAFGMGWLGLGVWWLAPGLASFSNAGRPFSLLLTAALAAYLALFPAAACAALAALAARRARRLEQGLRLWAATAALWTLSEWARANLWGGFPWLLSGTAHASAPLGAFAPLVGVIGVSWLNAFLAAMLADGLLHWRAGWPRRLGHSALALCAIGLACVLVAQQQWTTDTGQRLSVRLMQGNIPQYEKDTAAGLADAARKYTMLAESGTAELVLFPETAFPVAWDAMPAPLLLRWKQIASARNRTLLIGAFGAVGAKRIGSNSALALLPGSTSAGYDYRYDKVHLVPFGEQTWPWSVWLTDRVYTNFGALSAGGPEQAPLLLPKGPVGVGICFESLFDTATAAKARNAELLVNMTNFGWFDGSYAAAQHLQAGQMRARETGRWFVQVSNSGISALVRPDGALQSVLPSEVMGVLDGDVGLFRGATPFMKSGNTPLIAACALLLALLVLMPHTQRRPDPSPGALRSAAPTLSPP